MTGNSGEVGLALGTFFECRAESVFFPGAFLCRRLTRGAWSVAGRDGRGGSLDLITHGFAVQFVHVPVRTSKELTIPCYAKAKRGARGLGERLQFRQWSGGGEKE